MLISDQPKLQFNFLFFNPVIEVDAYNFVQISQCYIQRFGYKWSTLIGVIFCYKPTIIISWFSPDDHQLYSRREQLWIGTDITALLWGVMDKRPTPFCNNTVLNKSLGELKQYKNNIYFASNIWVPSFTPCRSTNDATTFGDLPDW